MNTMAARWCRLYKGTAAEISLEDAVARLGIPYRTQYPLFLYGARYFPDFVLPTLKVVIEVDDPSHNRSDKKLEDAIRTDEIRDKFGWTVVRVTNEAASTDPDGSVKTALASIGMWPLPLRLPRLSTCLPKSRSAPQAARREAKTQAIRASRSTPRQRRSSSN